MIAEHSLGAPEQVGRWQVLHSQGLARSLHDRVLGAEGMVAPVVHFLEIDRPALVLGSAQRLEGFDAAVKHRIEALDPARIEVCRRRSGGGAVWLTPESSVWIDVEIPASDPLWEDDIGRAFWWLGDVWRNTLGTLGLEAEVHRGPAVQSDLARQVCFAGIGSGEVIWAGHKVVGISQRRTRAGARFQCLLYREWDPGPLARIFALPDATVAGSLEAVVKAVDSPVSNIRTALLEAISGR